MCSERVMQHIVEQMSVKPTGTFKVSSSRYRRWQKLFSWDALQGRKFGQSFCQHFKIHDHILFYESDPGRCDNYIKRTYLTQ